LFPTGYGGIHPIRVGGWRDDAKGAMQVISGPISREKVHFEAPAAKRLQHEMDAFLAWANNANNPSGDEVIDPVLKAAVAHLWFVTVHPFDDGNGRIARAIADWALARSEGSSQRFYSMSSQIAGQSAARGVVYGDMLERTQKSTLDITEWIEWFLACLDRAITATESTLGAVFRKATFWDKYSGGTINERQKKMLNKLFDGFEGKLTSTKWAIIAKCSQDTAQRDIQGLIDQGILIKDAAGGRSTSYSLRDD
jgi:Fic family protein